jgi:DNA end-binding protein Ku
MAPRALWTGSLSFGLVNVPVRLYSAVTEHKLQFRFVHEKDESPIGYQKICKLEDKPVPDKEIVKAFEYRKGRYVHMTDEDFQAARVEGYRTIDITDFVPYEQIDPIYFAHSYYVGPQDGSEKVYSLLVRAMEDSELAAIAKFVMRDRQYLGALRVREGVITLEQLYFADEVRPVDAFRPKRERVAKGELEMARQLIDSFAGDWEPEKYSDTYRDALCDVIEAKRKGKDVHVAAEPEERLARRRARRPLEGRARQARPRRRDRGPLEDEQGGADRGPPHGRVARGPRILSPWSGSWTASTRCLSASSRPRGTSWRSAFATRASANRQRRSRGCASRPPRCGS